MPADRSPPRQGRATAAQARKRALVNRWGEARDRVGGTSVLGSGAVVVIPGTASPRGGVLVLNLDDEPLNICGIGRAIALIGSGKAEVVVTRCRPVRTSSVELERPSVIRLQKLVRRPRLAARLTRREVFARDNFTCQYCGVRARELTIDHVVPRRLGGRHTWENVVSACRSCNARKGGHPLSETRMRLARVPDRPSYGLWFLWVNRPDAEAAAAWTPYLPGASRA